MTCREFADFIADYAADELSEPIRASFELHLQRCANCREYLALYLTTVELARSMSLEGDCSAPEDLVSAILVARAQVGAAG